MSSLGLFGGLLTQLDAHLSCHQNAGVLVAAVSQTAGTEMAREG